LRERSFRPYWGGGWGESAVGHRRVVDFPEVFQPICCHRNRVLFISSTMIPRQQQWMIVNIALLVLVGFTQNGAAGFVGHRAYGSRSSNVKDEFICHRRWEFLLGRRAAYSTDHHGCKQEHVSSLPSREHQTMIPLEEDCCIVCEPLLDAIRQQDLRLISSTEAYRIFHGRGGLYNTIANGDDKKSHKCEHLTLDWFPPVWVLTSFQPQPLSPQELAVIDETLVSKFNAAVAAKANNSTNQKEEDTNNKYTEESSFAWVYQNRNQNNITTTIMRGTIPDPHIVSEQGARYLVQTTAQENKQQSKGKRHRGIFLDMANGRKWLREHAHEKRILNLFSYTCAFSVAALQGGAKEVVNIDKVQGALKIGQRNHELNGFAGSSSSSSDTARSDKSRARFLNHDIWKTWGKLRKLGPYDIIVVDPPSYQKGSFVAKKDYIKLIRRLPKMLVSYTRPRASTDRSSRENCADDEKRVAPTNNDGSTPPISQVLLCLNAPELGVDFLKHQVAEGAPQLKFVRRLENPPTFPAIDPDRALKVLLYELPPVAKE
jgi:23S rRNA (cytosine1962-C5)-methyltransferase